MNRTYLRRGRKMTIETAKDSLVLNQIIDQKTDTILVEEDCIVPDIKPNI